jgi:hypothetical protein
LPQRLSYVAHCVGSLTLLPFYILHEAVPHVICSCGSALHGFSREFFGSLSGIGTATSTPTTTTTPPNTQGQRRWRWG